jgi:hypothetical protein
MLAFAIVGHMVGDFLLQPDFIASRKKSSSLICALHCLVWTLCVIALAGWWKWWVFGVLFVTHFVQDRGNIIRWYMRLARQQNFTQPPLAPWSLIIVDNTFHLLALAIVARVLNAG